MHVLDANEIFWMTFYTYDRIMEEGGKNWADAFALYVRLIEQTRIQQTNQTRSLNVFLKKWLWRWDERLKKARKVLKDLWLIDDVEIRDTLGRIVSHYVRVNYLIDEKKLRTLSSTYNLSTSGLNGDVDKSTYGETDTNALSTKDINAWSTKDKLLGEQKIPTPSELVEAYKQNPQLVAKVKDESVIWLRVNYKQKRKSKAYKTVAWFIQQLIEDITTVSYWEIRYDVWDRLRYAYNKAINWDNMGIWRDDKMERWLNNQKRLNSLTPKQNE
jgi:hypothetical protein